MCLKICSENGFQFGFSIRALICFLCAILAWSLLHMLLDFNSYASTETHFEILTWQVNCLSFTEPKFHHNLSQTSWYCVWWKQQQNFLPPCFFFLCLTRPFSCGLMDFIKRAKHVVCIFLLFVLSLSLLNQLFLILITFITPNILCAKKIDSGNKAQISKTTKTC